MGLKIPWPGHLVSSLYPRFVISRFTPFPFGAEGGLRSLSVAFPGYLLIALS